MRPYDLFATTLHCMIPSIKVDLKKYLLGYDHIYPVSGITHISDDHIYFPRARPMLYETYHSHASLELNDKYHPHVSVDLADFYHPKHVLYSYAYVIGYSIDDLEGIIPIACCRYQNRWISGSGSQTVRLGRMVTGGREHDVLPRFGPS